MKLKDLEILVSPSDSPESDCRQEILRNAVVLERLREKLPGRVAREWIVDRAGTAVNWWPVALLKFRQPCPAPIQNAIPGTASAAGSTEKSAGADAGSSDREEDVIVAAWRVKGGSSKVPAIYFSAAKFDQRGFEGKRELDDEVARSVTQNIRRLWGKRHIRVFNEFTLTPLKRVDETLNARLALRQRIEAGDVTYDFGEQGAFRVGEPAAPPVAAETRVYSAGADRTPVDGLIRLLVKSIKVMHPSVGGGLLDPEASADRISVFLGADGANVLEIYSQPTSFYQGYALYRVVRGALDAYVVAPGWDGLAGQAAANAQHEEFAIILDGSSPPIHNLNIRLKDRKRIIDATATDYLCFFCKFVQGADGAYLVSRSVSDLAWREFPPVENERRDIVAKYIVGPAAATAVGDRGAGEQADGKKGATKFIRIATVNYGRALFLMVFEISAAGSVATLGNHWLIKDLPVRPFRLAPDASLLVRKPRG
jgi:hypothetical protein